MGVILSGNEITDESRLLGIQGDGLLNDSSVGVWPAATNICINGGFETNTTGWSAFLTAVLTRDTTGPKFGAASGKVAVSANIDGVQIDVTLAAATTYTASGWFKVPTGKTLLFRNLDAGGSPAFASATIFGATGTWQRASFTFVSGAGGAVTFQIYDVVASAYPYDFYFDGIQVEAGTIATPYVETNGAAATRSAARVRDAASLVDETQGWFAARMRMGWVNTADPSSNPVVFDWRDDASNLIQLRFDTTGNTWELQRRNTAGTGEVTKADTFSLSDVVTVIAAWDASSLKISVDGSVFTSAVAANIPTLAATLFDIGSIAGASEHIAADFLWVATGFGSLTDANAATIHGLGNTDPALTAIPGTPTMVWPANTGATTTLDASAPQFVAARPPQLRAEFYNNLSGAKLDLTALADADILGCTYQHKIGTIGTFTLQVAADAPAAQNAISGRRIWIYDGNYPVFKGVIRTREISVTSDGKLVLTLVGPSIADQLIGLTTGRGLVFEDSSLTTVVTSLVGSTDFSAGAIDTATITARRFDGRTKWDALVATAQAVDCSIREDILPATPLIDMGIFGASTGITLRNFPASSESLSANPYMKQIASLKVKAQSLDLCNRVVPWGQLDGLGGSQLNLGYVAPDNPVLLTRLYLPSSGTPTISPTFDSGWERTNTAVRLVALTDKSSTAMSSTTYSSDGATANRDIAAYQYIYGPLGVQTFGGNVTGQILASANAATSHKWQMCIRVVSADGTTVRGTVLPMSTYGNYLNFTTLENLTFPSTALTAVTSQTGDYLVIEFGYRQVPASAAQSTFRVGDNGSTDLPVDETTTTDTLNPWLEFSQPIVLGAALPSGAEYEVQTGTGPDGNPYYYIEDTDSQAIYGVRERWVQFKDILPLGLTNLDFAAAAQTLYGMAVTYLTRHLAEQVAYEVEVMGLRHVDPATGRANFKVGDTFRLQFDGWTQDSAGARNSYLNVDTDLYILDFTVTYDAAGTPSTKLTLATFLRALPTDGEAFRQLAQAVGIEQVAPLAVLRMGTFPTGPYVELTPDGINVVDSNGDLRGTLAGDGITITVGDTSSGATLNESGITVIGDQADPFLTTQNSAGTATTKLAIQSDGAFTLLNNRSGQKHVLFDIDKTLGAGVGASVNSLFNDGTPLHALFMVMCFNSATGAELGHIFGNAAVGTLRYAITTVTSAANGAATNPSISLNGSSGLDYNAAAATSTRFVGWAIVAYS